MCPAKRQQDAAVLHLRQRLVRAVAIHVEDARGGGPQVFFRHIVGAARVEDEHHHGLGLKGPQIPAVATFVRQADEDQPACFIGMPMIHLATLGHQGFVERLQQRHQSLEAVGQRAGRQVQAMTGEVGEQPLRGPAEGKPVRECKCLRTSDLW